MESDSQIESQDCSEPKTLDGISPSERLRSMYETGLYSDCSLFVEDQVISVHKLILAAASPKMEEMFLGPDATDEPVSVPYSLRVMQLILQHVYLQDMDIQSIDEAQDVIEAAHFFQMKDLVELCCAGIEPETLNDLWPALNLACLYNSRLLKEACLTLALKNKASLLGHSDQLFLLSPEAFAFLLSREVIQIESELEIIAIAAAWARNRDPDSEHLRAELERTGILKHLRFLALDHEQFQEFVAGDYGKEIFSPKELDQLQNSYYADSTDLDVSPVRIERMLEHRVPICGTDYLAVESNNDSFEVNVRLYESSTGVRSIIKMIVIPSQINPANILYDNVSHRTHYTEWILTEVYVHNKTIARGSFYDRIKYGDDVTILLNTFNCVPVYTQAQRGVDEEGESDTRRYYDARIKIMFKHDGFYPLAVETKFDENAPIKLLEPCRFIHEFVLISPDM